MAESTWPCIALSSQSGSSYICKNQSLSTNALQSTWLFSLQSNLIMEVKKWVFQHKHYLMQTSNVVLANENQTGLSIWFIMNEATINSLLLSIMHDYRRSWSFIIRGEMEMCLSEPVHSKRECWSHPVFMDFICRLAIFCMQDVWPALFDLSDEWQINQ